MPHPMGPDRRQRCRRDADDPGDAPARPRGGRRSATRRRSGRRPTRSATGSRSAAPSRTLVARDDVDAVYISTMNDLHRDHTIPRPRPASTSCARSRWRCRSRTDEAMLAACERAGVILGTNHHLPGCGTHRTIRRPGRRRRRRPRCSRSASSTPSCCRSGCRAGGWRASAGRRRRARRHLPRRRGHQPAGGRAPRRRRRAGRRSRAPWEAAAEDALMSTMRYANGTLVQTHDAFTVAHAPTGLHVIGDGRQRSWRPT